VTRSFLRLKSIWGRHGTTALHWDGSSARLPITARSSKARAAALGLPMGRGVEASPLRGAGVVFEAQTRSLAGIRGIHRALSRIRRRSPEPKLYTLKHFHFNSKLKAKFPF